MKRVAFVTIAMLAVLMVGAAGAYFTAQAQVPENVIRAGTIAISTEPTSSALSVDALSPGMVVVRPLAVVNDGVAPVSVVVTVAKKAGITEFWNALTCHVTCDGAILYDGPMSALRTTAMQLAPGALATLQFGIGLPATFGNELSADYAKLTVYVDAEQVR